LTDARLALLVDRVIEILSVSESDLLPASGDESLHACSQATLSMNGRMIHLLSPSHILRRKEREILAEFRATEEWRLQTWKSVSQ